eukprot:COSAG04_NODE_16789_length_489_cov_0.597436_1_plen_153_part_01
MRTAPPIASMRPSIMETAAGLERMLVKIPGRSGLRTLRPAHAQPEPPIPHALGSLSEWGGECGAAGCSGGGGGGGGGGADRGGCDVDEARQREYRELPLRRRVVATTSRGWGPGTVRVVAFEVGVPGWYITRGTAGCPVLHGIRGGPPLPHRH